MNEPKEIISALLAQAESDKDFQEWKKQHPTTPEEKAMTKEERIQHIINLMIELGFIDINEDDTETEDSETAV